MNFHGATNIAVRNRAWVAEHGYKLIEGRVCEDACALYRHRKPTDDPEAGRFGQLVAWVAFERDAPSGHRGHTGTCTSTTCDTQRLPLPSRRVLTRRSYRSAWGMPISEPR